MMTQAARMELASKVRLDRGYGHTPMLKGAACVPLRGRMAALGLQIMLALIQEIVYLKIYM